ncbi:chromate efflux transporter [SAR202 cluster bacterium AC-647-N09_OGT_505m]|nr:chromate efflux transporter [SAR202 cluster bacterium AC-647-N09_OGT_505m]
MQPDSSKGLVFEVFRVFLRLGLTSFGGPIAHLGYFREEVVARRKWLDEEAYADLIALCQFLPGPASSQVGIALGLKRAGLLGALAAWMGFTLPSAAALILFAYGITGFGDVSDAGWLRGLKIAAVAVVAVAIWGMARNLCPDRSRATMAIVAAISMLAWPTAIGQALIIILAGFAGWRFLSEDRDDSVSAEGFHVGHTVAVISLSLFGILLIGSPLLRQVVDNQSLQVFDSFFRAGSLVFGGGHVVLPLLQAHVVPPGWITNEEFIAGYGAAQAVPGPLFTFSAYLGTILHGNLNTGSSNSWIGGLFALAAIYVPSFLLVIGVVPFWNRLRGRSEFRRATRGINAVVVGLLLAALYNPVWTSAVHTRVDFGLTLAAFALLALWKWPPWLVVVLAALCGQLTTNL